MLAAACSSGGTGDAGGTGGAGGAGIDACAIVAGRNFTLDMTNYNHLVWDGVDYLFWSTNV